MNNEKLMAFVSKRNLSLNYKTALVLGGIFLVGAIVYKALSKKSNAQSYDIAQLKEQIQHIIDEQARQKQDLENCQNGGEELPDV